MKVQVLLEKDCYPFSKKQDEIFDVYGIEVGKSITMNYEGFMSFLFSSFDPICVHEEDGVLHLEHPYEY